MKSRPLKVGEYRKVKKWGELLATEGAFIDLKGDIDLGRSFFVQDMKPYCGSIQRIGNEDGVIGGVFEVDNFDFIAEFFTNDYYDENGNEIKLPETLKTITDFVNINKPKVKDLMYSGVVKLDLPTWHNDTDPLDQLEQEANLTLTKISKLREIEAKQVEMDKLGLEIEEMIEEYLK